MSTRLSKWNNNYFPFLQKKKKREKKSSSPFALLNQNLLDSSQNGLGSDIGNHIIWQA